MKHLHFSILLAVLMSMAGAKAWAYDIEVENDQGIQLCYNYINDGKELEVERLDINLRNKEFYLIIPETVTYMNRTRKVTRIGNYAVRDFRYLYSVTIPNSVTSIGEGAFYSCYSLLKVIIPNSVINIEAKAFQQCYGLKSVIIGNSVTSIGKQAFELCEKLSEVTIPNSVTSIGIRAFNRCTGLTSVSIPNSVTSIGEETFLGCGLTSVTIPNSVSSIGDYAFLGCSRLTSVTIPNSVTSIGGSAFKGCSGLKKVIVKDIAAWCNIKFSLSGNPLYYAEHLYSDENTEITDLVIPNSVTSIGDNAFENCSGLTSVTIPNSVTRIGQEAFYGCSGLTSVTIPNSVTSIGYGAFYRCSGLTSVTIPNSVTSIGNSAFLECKKLLEIISLIEDPANCDCGSSTFEKDTKMNATLYVPKGTTDKYKKTKVWKEFVWIEEGVPSGIENTETKERRGTFHRYTLDGVETSMEKKGINIIKTKDGTTKKVLIK